ncbi:hypothetical protein Tco_0751678 [Tanacetum coccineum]|uniref:Uncharacterized protein n=1 Tax=Tanacetum coccineum TaxID=301880 RepID=A0ABQ4Z7X1_9ASTR
MDVSSKVRLECSSGKDVDNLGVFGISTMSFKVSALTASDWVESTNLMSARSIEEFEERKEDNGGCTRMLKLQYPSSAFDIQINITCDDSFCDQVPTIWIVLPRVIGNAGLGSNLLEADSGIVKMTVLKMNPRLQNKSALPLEVKEKLATVLAQPTALVQPPLSRDLSYSLQWSGNSTINAEMQQQGYNVKKKMESQEG